MAKQHINNKVITYRLHVSFIITLFLLILCFYFFPRFKSFHSDKNQPDTLTIDIIEIPLTIQNKITQSKNLKPDLPLEIAEIKILDSVLIEIQEKVRQNTGTKSDSQMIIFISSMFPKLLEIKEFDPQSIIESSKKIYNFKDYFTYRMKLPDTGKPHQPSSPLVDEALDKSEEMIMIDIFKIPLSSTRIKNFTKQQLTLYDLLAVRDHFHLLEYFYDRPTVSLIELYNIKNVNESYTLDILSDAVDALWKQGLIKVEMKQNTKIYSVAFILSDMIENINRILTEISEQDQQNREYLFDLIHLLISWS